MAIGDCSTRGLGLRDGTGNSSERDIELRYEDVINYPPFSDLNDFTGQENYIHHGRAPFDVTSMPEAIWFCGIEENTVNSGSENTMLLIKKGTKNFVLNQIGTVPGDKADNDIQLFTRDGKHLAGRTPIPDYEKFGAFGNPPTDLASNCAYIGFTIDQYDASHINAGARDQDNGATMNFTTYNGMTIGYSGDGPPEYDGIARYEVLAIDEVTEDLVVWLPGIAGAVFKYYIGTADAWNTDELPTAAGQLIAIDTQEKAQKALSRINAAIIKKDEVRAHLGALQNRLENTIANLSIQGENLQAAESRISDSDIATEMTRFVRNQVLSQSALAMLGQANTYPRMLINLLSG